MKSEIQRVTKASVTINGIVVDQFNQGLLVVLGIEIPILTTILIGYRKKLITFAFLMTTLV